METSRLPTTTDPSQFLEADHRVWQPGVGHLKNALMNQPAVLGDLVHELAADLDHLNEQFQWNPSTIQDVQEGKLPADIYTDLYFNLRGLYFHVAAPLCDLSTSFFKDRLLTDNILTEEHGGKPTVTTAVQQKIASGATPRVRLAEVWSLVVPPIYDAVKDMTSYVTSFEQGQALWKFGESVIRQLATLEVVSKPNKETNPATNMSGNFLDEDSLRRSSHFTSLADGIELQQLTGAIIWRKFTDLLPRLYAEYGVKLDAPSLRVLAEASIFPEQAARMKPVQLVAALKVLSGCTKECYTDDPNGSPHSLLYKNSYSGNIREFHSSHATAAWFDASKWGLFHPGPMPWPTVDLAAVSDPSGLSDTENLKPILALPSASNGGCPATAFGGISRMFQSLNAVAYCEEMMGYYIATAQKTLQQQGSLNRNISPQGSPLYSLHPDRPVVAQRLSKGDPHLVYTLGRAAIKQ